MLMLQNLSANTAYSMQCIFGKLVMCLLVTFRELSNSVRIYESSLSALFKYVTALFGYGWVLLEVTRTTNESRLKSAAHMCIVTDPDTPLWSPFFHLVMVCSCKDNERLHCLQVIQNRTDYHLLHWQSCKLLGYQ